MNIFFVDDDPVIAAQSLGDKHVGKMLVESAQMLFTAVRQHGYDGGGYKSAYEHHPMTKWVAKSYLHAQWLLDHAIALAKEFELRYNHEHKTKSMLPVLSMAVHHHMPDEPWHNPPRCMPDIYKIAFNSWRGEVPCHVASYRDFYRCEKTTCHVYTNRQAPDWLTEVIDEVPHD